MENSYEFKQAAHIQGRDYRRGVHTVPEKVEYDPYFLKLVGLGLIVEAHPVKKISTTGSKERSKLLLDKLVSKHQGKKVVPVSQRETMANLSGAKPKTEPPKEVTPAMTPSDTEGKDKPAEKAEPKEEGKPHADKHGKSGKFGK